MGRPKLKPGQIGKINTKRIAHRHYLARAYTRTIADERIEVQGTGTTAELARDQLSVNARTRAYSGMGEGITGATTISVLVERTIANLRAGKGTPKPLKRQTVDMYETVLPVLAGDTGHSAIGNLRLVDAPTSLIHSWLERLSESTPATAKRCKVVLTHAFNLAMRHIPELWGVNPAKDARLSSGVEAEPRALTDLELHRVRKLVRAWQTSRKRVDLVNYVELLIATGVRPSEALAVRWQDLRLDITPATLEVNGTIVEHKGVGLVRQDNPKTKAGWRVLALPEWAVSMLRDLRVNATSEYVFPNERGGIMSPRNMRTKFREAIGGEIEGVTLRSFRPTIATKLERTVGVREAARQLGHESPAITGRHYIERAAEAGDYTAIFAGYAPKESTG